MIISTWNINSIKVRLPAVLQYLDEFSPDVLVLQETKSTDDNFPVDEIVNSGYSVVFYGQKTYNGVAIISKTKPSSVDYNPVKTSANEARSITAVIDGITIVNLYVVNGKDVGTDKYAYKLEWLKKLHSYAKSLLCKTDQLVMLG
jgi:exodeoxyribonuclease-3